MPLHAGSSMVGSQDVTLARWTFPFDSVIQPLLEEITGMPGSGSLESAGGAEDETGVMVTTGAESPADDVDGDALAQPVTPKAARMERRRESRGFTMRTIAQLRKDHSWLCLGSGCIAATFDVRAKEGGGFERIGANFFLKEEFDDAEFEVQQGAVGEQRFSTGNRVETEKPPAIGDIVGTGRVEPESHERRSFATRADRILARDFLVSLSQRDDEVVAFSRSESSFLRAREDVKIRRGGEEHVEHFGGWGGDDDIAKASNEVAGGQFDIEGAFDHFTAGQPFFLVGCQAVCKRIVR